MRYLIYHIDKCQEHCWFTDNPTGDDYHRCDAGWSVIVDLQLKLRYFAGKWHNCDER